MVSSVRQKVLIDLTRFSSEKRVFFDIVEASKYITIIQLKTKRAVKIGYKQNKEFDSLIKKVLKLQNDISFAMFDLIQSGDIKNTIPKDEIIGEPVKGADSFYYKRKGYTDNTMREIPEFNNIIEKNGFNIETVNKSRLTVILREVWRRYKSYLGRNKKMPKKPIDIRNKAVNLSKGFIQVIRNENGKIIGISIAKFGLKDKSEIILEVDESNPYHHVKRANALKFDKKTNRTISGENNKYIGGNLDLRKRLLVITIDSEFQMPDSEKFISFDINKNKKHFMTFSEPVNEKYHFKKPDELAKVEAAIHHLNDHINDPKISSQQRKRKRKRCIINHKKSKNILRKYVESILSQKEFQNKVVCIDTPATGQSNGTFGQDKIPDLCVQYCLKNGMPFILVPTPYTSKRCNSCGEINGENRNGDKFKCVKCGHEDHSDINAAKNIKQFGEYLYDHEDYTAAEKATKQYCGRYANILKEYFNFPRNPK